MSTHSIVVAVGLLVGAVFQAPAGQVSGTFKTVKQGAIQPVAATAFPVRAPGDPQKRVTVVVLAEGAMDAAAAVLALDPHTALTNQPGMRGRNYISLWVRPDGSLGMNATFSKGMVQYIDSTKAKAGEEDLTAQSLVAELRVNGPDRIAGRVRTGKPGSTMSGDTYELDVTFDVPITRGPAARALGAGGGEPGRVAQTLLTALRTKDWPALRSCVKAETLAEVVTSDASDGDNFKAVADSVSLLLPKGKASVVGGEETGDSAVIEVRGEMTDDGGVEALYLLRMVKEAQGWRFDWATVAGFL